MEVQLGVDTLSYHCRLVAGEISLFAVLEEVAALGGEFVQLNARHLNSVSEGGVDELRRTANGLGLGLTLAGDVLGCAERGDSVAKGVSRLQGWMELANRLGSPFVRVSSGFYRNEMLGDGAVIRAELEYVVGALRGAASGSDVRILLENHSDFTPDEYVEIVERVGRDRVGVFLDLINPVSLLLDPLPVIERLAPMASAGHAKDYRICSNYVEDGAHRRGFEVQWCYPGEGVADLPALVAALGMVKSSLPYYLSIEGLDNRAGVADQKDRLGDSLSLLQDLVTAANLG